MWVFSAMSCWNLTDRSEQLAVLGYSCDHDGFAFNFASSLAARKIISDFIASNVKVSGKKASELIGTDEKSLVYAR